MIGSWTFQDSKGTPPPCNGFSFVLFSKDNVLRFGGNDQKKECVNRLDILDLIQWVCSNLVECLQTLQLCVISVVM